MDYLQQLLENYNLPIVSAFILGLMTSISPCPLATNITATAYISKNMTSKNKVVWSGILYFLGRAFSYTVIGLILYFGASKFHLAKFFNQYGEKFLGPLLIIIGLIMLSILKLNFFQGSNFQSQFSDRLEDKGLFGSFLIGVIFALAFCPYSGALYFGMLIPISITSFDGLYLPIVFAFGTGLPVLLFTYLLAFTASKVGMFYNRITKVEKILRYFAGVVFLLAGLYYMLIFLKLI